MTPDIPPDCSALVAATRAMPADERDMKAWLARFTEREECRRLRDAGWSPLPAVAAAGRDVRRASFNDGRFAFRIPAAALEKDGRGAVTISLGGPGMGRRTATVPAEVWALFEARDESARMPPPSLPPGAAPPMIMHCDHALLEVAAGGRSWTRSLQDCGGDDRAALGYAYDLAWIAIDYIPACEAARRPPGERKDRRRVESPLWALIKCGGRFDPLTLPQ